MASTVTSVYAATKPTDINDLEERIIIVVHYVPTGMCERAMACMVKGLHTYIEDQEVQVEGRSVLTSFRILYMVNINILLK